MILIIDEAVDELWNYQFQNLHSSSESMQGFKKKKKKKNSLGRNAATLTSLTSDRLFITTETQEDCDKWAF